MNKDKIGYTVDLYLDIVTLKIWTNKKFKNETHNSEAFGYFEVGVSNKDKENCLWDNLQFFINCGRKEFKKECKEELLSKGFDVEEVYSEIQRLIKQAKKLKLLENE